MADSDFETSPLRLAALVESSDDAIVSKDLDGTIRSWNPAAERLFGYTAAEVIGRSIRLIIPADRQDEEDDVLRRIRRGDSVAHFETIRQRKDGELVPISLTVSPIRSESGQIIGASKIARDISEQRMAEHALAIAEHSRAGLQHRLLTLVAASRSLLSSPLVEHVRPAILKLARQLIAADAYALWHLDPLSKTWRIDLAHGLSDSFTATALAVEFENGRPVAPANAVRIPDVALATSTSQRREAYDREGIQALLAMPLNPLGDTTGSIVFYYHRPQEFDETDVQAGMALANLASAALSNVALHDAQRRSRLDADFLAESGKMLSASLDYEETLKHVAELAVPYFADWCAVDLLEDDKIRRITLAHVDPARARQAERFAEEYPTDPASPFSVPWVIRTGEPVIMSEMSDALFEAHARDASHLRALRDLRLTSFMMVPLRVHGRTFGAITLASAESGRHYDAGDLRLAQEIGYRAATAVDNARAYAEARRANRVKDDFLATLSHELRTPLNALVGYTRMLKLGILGRDGLGRAYDVIDRNASALTRIVNDVLDMSRIVSGKLRLSVRRVNLADAILQSIEAVQLAADAKGIQIEMHLPLAPVFSRVDPDRVQQLVWNLLSNAVKFTPRDGRIDVTLGLDDAGVIIAVRDTGIGIAPEFLPHVFERFEQADSRYAREHGGLGLGLAIARHLAELHGGTVAAASEGPGRGAEFTIRLPQMEPRAPAVDGDTQPAGDLALPRIDGVSLLVVDDERDALTMVREVLEAAGARVTTASSAEEALQMLDHHVPDVVLTDIGMPGMDGFDLIARIRGRAPEAGGRVPAVALTAYVRSDERDRALAAGFDLHLSKPVDPFSLLRVLRELTAGVKP